MKDKRKPSIWQRDVFLPEVRLGTLFPPGLEEWFAVFSVALFILAPAIMAVLALIHRDIDYTFVVHPRLIQDYIYRFSSVFILFAMLLFGLRQAKHRGLGSLIRENRALLCFLFAAGWMLLSQGVNGLLGDTALSVVTREETYPMQIGYFLLLLPAGALVRSEKKKRWLFRLHGLVSLVLFVATPVLHSAQQTSLYFYDWRPDFTSIYTNRNYYSYYLTISISLAAAMFIAEKKLRWKGFFALVLGLNTVALTFADTLGAWVACLAAMLFILITHAILEKRMNRDALIAVLLFVYAFILSGIESGFLQKNLSIVLKDYRNIATQSEDIDRAGSGRWHIWAKSMELIGQNPLFGIGFEGIYLRDLKEYVYNTRPHNEVMQYALFYGIPVGLSYLAGCIGIYIRALRKKRMLGLITLASLTAAFGYLVSSCFGITLYCTAPFLFLFLGMGYVSASQNEPQNRCHGDGSQNTNP